MNDMRRVWTSLLMLGILCVLVSSRWLLEQGSAAAGATLGSQAVGSLMAAACLAGWMTLRSRASHAVKPGGGLRPSDAGGLRTFGIALALAGPALASAISGRRISSNNGVLSMALAPVVISTLSTVLDPDGTADLLGALWPGLAGLMGLLLLLPEPALEGWRPWCGLVCMPLLTGVGASLAVALPRAERPPTEPIAWHPAFGCVLAAAVFWSLAALQGEHGRPSLVACGLDGVTFLLSVLVLVNLGASRWSVQFLVIPLLSLLEGIVLLRPTLEVRSWMGLICLVAGALGLLLFSRREAAAESTLGLR